MDRNLPSTTNDDDSEHDGCLYDELNTDISNQEVISAIKKLEGALNEMIISCEQTLSLSLAKIFARYSAIVSTCQLEQKVSYQYIMKLIQLMYIIIDLELPETMQKRYFMQL